MESVVVMMKTRPLITYKEHFFRKGDKVRVMWIKELKELGYDVYFNENGDLMDGTNKILFFVLGIVVFAVVYYFYSFAKGLRLIPITRLMAWR